MVRLERVHSYGSPRRYERFRCLESAGRGTSESWRPCGLSSPSWRSFGACMAGLSRLWRSWSVGAHGGCSICCPCGSRSQGGRAAFWTHTASSGIRAALFSCGSREFSLLSPYTIPRYFVEVRVNWCYLAYSHTAGPAPLMTAWRHSSLMDTALNRLSGPHSPFDVTTPSGVPSVKSERWNKVCVVVPSNTCFPSIFACPADLRSVGHTQRLEKNGM